MMFREPVRYVADGDRRYRYAGVNPRLNVCVYLLDEENENGDH
jgi:hypothetical protein